ncbi:DNA repair protein XRCC3 isoform X2 [Saccopteryx leptura]|uniref:DNA repair protein XRCC3 isoform X2 n=1 Tax=Saccopteryx leptura TaxID=249018 RepID=UPI00339C2286
MDLGQLDLNPRIMAAMKKAKLKSMQEVLHFSGPDLQRLTGLSAPDVQLVLRAVSSHLRGSSVCTGQRCAVFLPGPGAFWGPPPCHHSAPGWGPWAQTPPRRGCGAWWWHRAKGPLRMSRSLGQGAQEAGCIAAGPAWGPGCGPRLALWQPAHRGPDTAAPPALDLHLQKERFPEQHQRLSLGCPVLDALLRGGLPLDGITELAGRSSAGKTQLALQLCLAVQFPRRLGGLEAGAVYICTEDAFPDKRLQQLMAQQLRLRTDAPEDIVEKIRFGDHIFIEHVANVDMLLECVRTKVPVLLSRGLARLVVIDSVAAPFRCEFDGPASVHRARALQTLGAALRRLSGAFRSPVLCINQTQEMSL